MRLIFDVKGCFFTCSCPEDWKVKYGQNLLRLGTNDWWNLVTVSYTPKQRAIVTLDQFLDMSRMRYVPLVERKKLAQEYLFLRHTMDIMM